MSTFIASLQESQLSGITRQGEIVVHTSSISDEVYIETVRCRGDVWAGDADRAEEVAIAILYAVKTLRESP
jgi:hypothetical protein